VSEKKIEYEEVEGILCEVKNPARKPVVRFYQESLRPEIDKYIGNNRMVEKKKAYADALEVNLIIAPFVLGWLKRPTDEDEYRVITGRMTMDELNKKREESKKPATKKRANKKPLAKEAKPVVSKPTPPKKPEAPKKPTPPKKPVLKKEDNIKGQKGAIKDSKVAANKTTPATKKLASPTKPVVKKKESAPIKGATKGSQTAQKPAETKKATPKVAPKNKPKKD